jgi:peroxiredoxin
LGISLGDNPIVHQFIRKIINMSINLLKNCLRIFIALLLVSLNAKAANTSITRPETFFAPDTSFFNVNGEKVYLDQYEGKTILLAFWATWCGGCISEMASLNALQKDFKHLPFEVIAVSEDYNGVTVVEEHYRVQQIRHLPIYHDYQNQLFKAMSVAGLPTAFLIDQSGRVKVVFKGEVKWHDKEIRDIILSEIAGNPEPPKNSYKPSSLNNVVPSKKLEQELTQIESNEVKKNNDSKNEEKQIKE